MVVSLDCGDEAAQAAPLLGRKWFRGSIMQEPWKQKVEKWSKQLVQKLEQVHRDDQSLHPGQLHRASLATAMQ